MPATLSELVLKEAFQNAPSVSQTTADNNRCQCEENLVGLKSKDTNGEIKLHHVSESVTIISTIDSILL